MTKVWKNAEWRVSGEGSDENTNWVNPVDFCQLGTVDSEHLSDWKQSEGRDFSFSLTHNS